MTHIDDLSKTKASLDINQILDTLEERFLNEIYYTEASITLIALNPFKNSDYLYTKKCMKMYLDYFYDECTLSSNRSNSNNHCNLVMSRVRDSCYTKYNLNCESNLKVKEAYLYDRLPPAPHIYKYASLTWRQIMHSSSNSIRNQSIIVSGESGSGKTKTISYIISYFAFISSKHSHSSLIENNLLLANVILESFGNAQTTLNDNSSRFGKYIELRFNVAKQMSEAKIYTYLLEKTRVVSQQTNERNFHIFYQIINGLNDVEKERFHVTKSLVRHFKHSNTYDDLIKWKILRSSFTQLKIDSSIDQIIKFLVAISHLTCCVYTQISLENGEISLILGKKSREHLEHASNLLGLELDELDAKLREREICVSVLSRRQSIKINCSLCEIDSRKDCLAKLLYSELFLWLITRINDKLKVSTSDNFAHHIGLLDLYGFENLYSNSLEQLCINYANERLQQIFLDYFIKSKQADYALEGIKWKNPTCNFIDNKLILDSLHTGTRCLFNILNEECYLKRNVEPLKLKSKIQVLLGQEDNIKCRLTGNFCIRHYAGEVYYRCDGLVDKNRDCLPPDLLTYMINSKNSFVLEILKAVFNKHSITQNGSKTNLCSLRNRSSQSTILTRFKAQLDDLMSKLKLTRIQYIRCIKPNENFCSKTFDRLVVMRQLETSGVISIMNMNKHYYPHKMNFKLFLEQYLVLLRFKEEILVKKVLASRPLDDLTCETLKKLKKIVKLVLKNYDKSNYLVGKKLIFLNDYVLLDLERQLLELQNKMAQKIQNFLRNNLLFKKKSSKKSFQRSCYSTDEMDVIIGLNTNRNSYLRDTQSCPEIKIIHLSTSDDMLPDSEFYGLCKSSKCNLNDSNLCLFYVSDSASILTKRKPEFNKPSLSDCL